MGVDKHSARAAGGIVDRLVGVRLNDANETVDDLGWREKLASLSAGIVSKLLDQVLVCASQHVRGHVGVGEGHLVEGLDEFVRDLVGNQFALTVGSRLVPRD